MEVSMPKNLNLTQKDHERAAVVTQNIESALVNDRPLRPPRMPVRKKNLSNKPLEGESNNESQVKPPTKPPRKRLTVIRSPTTSAGKADIASDRKSQVTDPARRSRFLGKPLERKPNITGQVKKPLGAIGKSLTSSRSSTNCTETKYADSNRKGQVVKPMGQPRRSIFSSEPRTSLQGTEASVGKPTATVQNKKVAGPPSKRSISIRPSKAPVEKKDSDRSSKSQITALVDQSGSSMLSSKTRISLGQTKALKDKASLDRQVKTPPGPSRKGLASIKSSTISAEKADTGSVSKDKVTKSTGRNTFSGKSRVPLSRTKVVESKSNIEGKIKKPIEQPRKSLTSIRSHKMSDGKKDHEPDSKCQVTKITDLQRRSILSTQSRILVKTPSAALRKSVTLNRPSMNAVEMKNLDPNKESRVVEPIGQPRKSILSSKPRLSLTGSKILEIKPQKTVQFKSPIGFGSSFRPSKASTEMKDSNRTGKRQVVKPTEQPQRSIFSSKQRPSLAGIKVLDGKPNIEGRIKKTAEAKPPRKSQTASQISKMSAGNKYAVNKDNIKGQDTKHTQKSLVLEESLIMSIGSINLKPLNGPTVTSTPRMMRNRAAVMRASLHQKVLFSI